MRRERRIHNLLFNRSAEIDPTNNRDSKIQTCKGFCADREIFNYRTMPDDTGMFFYVLQCIEWGTTCTGVLVFKKRSSSLRKKKEPYM